MTIGEYNNFLQRLNCNGTRKIDYNLYGPIKEDKNG